MKTEILKELRNAKDYVSGQLLCEKYGVSRTAVWKAVKQLKEAGYEIESVQNKGYFLKSSPEMMSKEEIESRLNTKWLAKPLYYFDIIDSTNAYARMLGDKNGTDGTLVVADCQEKGKGRRGRDWSSPRGNSIFMSLLLKPQMHPENVSAITLVMALSVTRAMREMYGILTEIKWPNDIVSHGKKLCGILTEMSIEDNEIKHIVIGIGINVNNEEFPKEIMDKATSLYLELGERKNRSDLISAIIGQFEKDVECFYRTGDLSELMEEYNGYLVNKDKEIRVLEPNHEYTGIGRGINQKGELIVETQTGLKEIYSGEVSVRGIYGYV